MAALQPSAVSAAMVPLIEAIRAAVAWWQSGLAQPGWTDLALISLLLVWVWWRHISPFGRANAWGLVLAIPVLLRTRIT